MTSWTGISDGEEATERLGERLGRALPAGAVLSLEGDLGAGKTTFVRGLARGLGADPDEVSSPTYTLMHEVPGRLTLYHFDAWIQARERAFLEGGGGEWLFGDGVCAVEWGGGVATHLPAPRLRVALEHLGPERRGITVELVDPPGGTRAGASAEALTAAVEALGDSAGGHEPAGSARVGGGR